MHIFVMKYKNKVSVQNAKIHRRGLTGTECQGVMFSSSQASPELNNKTQTNHSNYKGFSSLRQHNSVSDHICQNFS